MIPNKWMNYSPIGKVIGETGLIAFKVPLTPSICQKLSPRDKFTLEDLISRVPRLGLVIDLTNTTRYYNPAILAKNNIIHKKIFLPGHGVLPEATQINQFISFIDEFLAANRDRLVGVHCTHGLNRTGFMICRYLIDRKKLTAQEAINVFEEARGYPIERPTYRQSLLGLPVDFSVIPKSRYRGPTCRPTVQQPFTPQMGYVQPPIPSWCRPPAASTSYRLTDMRLRTPSGGHNVLNASRRPSDNRRSQYHQDGDIANYGFNDHPYRANQQLDPWSRESNRSGNRFNQPYDLRDRPSQNGAARGPRSQRNRGHDRDRNRGNNHERK